MEGRCEQDAEHLGLAMDGPESETVQADEDQQLGDERVEQIEAGGTEQQRKEEAAGLRWSSTSRWMSDSGRHDK